MLAEPVPEGVRPTASRVREALFSLVGQDLRGVRVLDAYAGSGLLGLEAWSRGASVVAVERDPAIAEGIRRNATALGAELEVRTGDALALAGALGAFGLVLVDPPYAIAPGPVLERLAACSSDVLLIETDAAVDPGAGPEGFDRDRHKVYGGTALTLYRRR